MQNATWIVGAVLLLVFLAVIAVLVLATSKNYWRAENTERLYRKASKERDSVKEILDESYDRIDQYSEMLQEARSIAASRLSKITALEDRLKEVTADRDDATATLFAVEVHLSDEREIVKNLEAANANLVNLNDTRVALSQLAQKQIEELTKKNEYLAMRNQHDLSLINKLNADISSLVLEVENLNQNISTIEGLNDPVHEPTV